MVSACAADAAISSATTTQAGSGRPKVIVTVVVMSISLLSENYIRT